MRRLPSVHCAARAQLEACRKMHDEEVKALKHELGQAGNVIAVFAHDYELLQRTNDMLERQLREERARTAALERTVRVYEGHMVFSTVSGRRLWLG